MDDPAADQVLIGGIEKREITIRDYDPGWQKIFCRHSKVIRDALGDVALRIEHVGSTAVPGLAAKPIVDMLLIVADSSDEASYLSRMEKAGYRLRVREPEFQQHRMFRTPGLDVHIHVFSRDSAETERLLIFRDRLRTNAHDRQLYEQTKRALAAQDWPDMNAYAEAKSTVMQGIIVAARADGQASP